MQLALHDPRKGYYANNIRTVGQSGDFSTTATLSPLLGRAIAHSALTWSKETKSPLNLIEVGAGDGSLAKSVIEHIPLFKRLRLNYHIVDTSAPLVEKQRTKLKGKKAKWHDDIVTALKDCQGVAFIFSNELVDAFPVRIFKKGQSNWQELHYTDHTETFLDVEAIPETSADQHIEGQRIEIHESYRDWLRSWLPHWKSGQLLTIDYGDTYPEIFCRRPSGTIRAYFHHHLRSGIEIYQNIGHQDITADVNFTDLMEWGEQDGLDTVSLISQNEYLTPFARQTEQDQFLIHPDGSGSAFKVLLQQKRL